MRISRRFQFLGLALAVVGFLATAGVGLAADEVCSGVAKEGRVTRLDGGHAVVDKTVATRADLTAFGREYAEILGGVLKAQGLESATETILQAIENGPVTEVKLNKGDTLEWMATRKSGAVSAFGPVCMASETVYDAWKFDVKIDGLLKETIHTFVIPKVCGNLALEGTRTVVKPPIPVPVVFLGIDRDCETGIIHIDSAGSDANARIEMLSSEGVGHQVEPGDIEDPARYTGDLTFRVVAENSARDGKIQKTEKEVTVPACPAPPAECSLALNGDDFFTRQPIIVNADGHWVEGGFALRVLDGKGREVERLVPGPALPYTTVLKKPGLYRIQGGATNEIGEEAGCESTVLIRPRWNVRPKAVIISPTDRKTGFTFPDGTGGTQVFQSDLAAELDLEYHPTRLIGLEIGALGGSLGSKRVLSTFEEGTDSVGVTMAHLALNFHFRGRSGVDFFLGPVVAWVDVDDADFGPAGNWQGGSDTGVGAQLGLDIPLGAATAWSLTGGIRYLDAAFDDDAMTGSVAMDPMIANLGLSYGF